MARTPIQSMVDQACGISPAEIERMQQEAKALEEKQTKALLSVERAARLWWARNRPVGWTVEQHLKNPTIGAMNVDEEKLARAVAKWVKLGG